MKKGVSKKEFFNVFSSLKKFWHFVWKEDSIWSWLVSLIIIFLIVRFIFFPFLSLITGSSLPLVVVESSSMSHDGILWGGFDSWWDQNQEWYENNGIFIGETENWILRGGLEKGDIVIVIGADQPRVGDVIVFEAGQRHPIIHRIVNVRNSGGEIIYSTKGDSNAGQLAFEKSVVKEQIIGRAVFKIPKLGWIKLAFVEFFSLFS